jgi:hypothetical protein
MSPEDFLNATRYAHIGGRFVADCGDYRVIVELSDDGWIAGVRDASGARWLQKTSNPETGKREATEMLAKLAKIELRQELRNTDRAPPSPRGASLAVPRLPPVQARQIPVGQRALARGCRGEYIIHRAIGAGVDATEELGSGEGGEWRLADDR